MKVMNQERQDNGRLRFVLHVDADEFDRDREKVYRKNRGKYVMPGFRRGKASRRMLEQHYGRGLFEEQAINENFNEYFVRALDEYGIDELATSKEDGPTFTLKGVVDGGYDVECVVPVRPEATITQYKGLEAPRYALEVTEADVDRIMQTYVERATRLNSVEREAVEGDVLNLDYVGTVDGEPFEGGSDNGASLLLGSHTFIPGFEEQLVGVKPDQELDVNVTFPENYVAKDLAGKAAVFHVKVHSVQEREIPELDDEFAKDVSEFETLADFRADLAKQETERREQQATREFETLILNQLMGNTTVELPESMVQFEQQYVINELKQQLQYEALYRGMKPEEFLRKNGFSEERITQMGRSQAEANVRLSLALYTIAQLEGLKAEPEEIEAEYAKMVREDRPLEKVKEEYPLSFIRPEILERKARELVLANAVAKTPDDYKATEVVGELPEEVPAEDNAAEEAETEALVAEAAEEAPVAEAAAEEAPAEQAPAEEPRAFEAPAAE